MRQTRPLPDTHPEFTVTQWPGFAEYTVEHWRLARDGTGRIVHGTCVCSWVDVGVLMIIAALLVQSEVSASRPALLSISIVFTWLVWARFTQVLHESLLVFPTLGIQLETHRGHPLLPTLSTTRHFIPLSALEDVIIHEGFRRWNVRYYLAALRRTRATIEGPGAREGEAKGGIQVRVAFENVLPYFPVLKQVYLGVQETLFSPPIQVVDMDRKLTHMQRQV
ncbi:hypothetical protein V8E55_009888 [Tylopilus felleus]